MKAFRDSSKRFLGGVLVCLCAALLALQPGVAHAGPPTPVITVAVVSPPLQLHVQGWHFTPGSTVVVTVKYLPALTVLHKTTTATPSGTIAVSLPAGPFCGTYIDEVVAFNRPTQTYSNLVIRTFSFRPCGSGGTTPPR